MMPLNIQMSDNIKEYSDLLELVCEYLSLKFKQYNFDIVLYFNSVIRINMPIDYSKEEDILKIHIPNFTTYYYDLNDNNLHMNCPIRGRCEVYDFDAWLRKRKIENILNM